VRNADDSRSAGPWGRPDAHGGEGEAAIAEPAEQTPRQQLADMVPPGQPGQPGQHEFTEPAE
jgi:hypothetical protein